METRGSRALALSTRTLAGLGAVVAAIGLIAVYSAVVAEEPGHVPIGWRFAAIGAVLTVVGITLTVLLARARQRRG